MTAFSRTDGAVTRFVGYEMSSPALCSDINPGWGDDRFNQIGIKFWADGSPWVGNIETTFPYLSTSVTEAMGLDAHHMGKGNYSAEQMTAIAEAYFPLGWQLSCHVHGDAIADRVLDVYEHILAKYPRPDHRLRIEHCGALRRDQYQRCAGLGVTASLFPTHVYYWGDVLIDGLFGPERAADWAAARDAVDAGLRISLHNDAPVTPETPLLNVQVAVCRRTRSGRSIGPRQALTVTEALRAVTIDAAWQLFMDDRIGSLTVGKYADLVMLDASPLRVEPGKIGDLSVLATWLAGREVFRQDA
jgi:predicted amidohydrolase YtcJ